MNSYRIALYSPEDKDSVAALAQHLWGPDLQLNATYLHWKYHRNPYIREPLIYLAFSDDRLVGMRGAFGSKWMVGQLPECFILPYPDDLVVDPSHRVKGLHRRLMEFGLNDLRQRGYRYVVNLSASKVTALGSLRMKWRSAGGVKPVLRRTRCRRVADRIAGRFRLWPLLWRWADTVEVACSPPVDRLFDRLDARLTKKDHPPKTTSLFITSMPLSREMADLVAALPRDGRICHVRDQAYFDWRYSNPLNTYRFLYAAGERIEGYLVLGRSLSGIADRVAVVDWEARSDRAREELLAATVTFGKFSDLYAWTATLPPSAVNLYARYGFEPAHLPYETSILVRSLREDEPSEEWALGGCHLDDVQCWDLRMVYSMRN